MIIVSNTGALNGDRIKYENPYGATAVIPVEASQDVPMNVPNDAEMLFQEGMENRKKIIIILYSPPYW